MKFLAVRAMTQSMDHLEKIDLSVVQVTMLSTAPLAMIATYLRLEMAKTLSTTMTTDRIAAWMS
ncbi:hypothetical protein D3C87_1791370 [compost metagenome]